MHHREDPRGSETNTRSVPPPEYERAPSVHREVGPEDERRQRPGRGDPWRREHGQQNAEPERRRHDLPEGHDPADLERNERLEKAVLIVHAPQLAQRAPRVVGADDAGYQQDPPARPEHPETEFLILVPHQFFVEQPQPLEQFAPEATERQRVNLANFVRSETVARVADPD